MNETNSWATTPLVSVIIPTLNRGKYLRQCIESALSQDYPNIEVIVVDNGSTDNTLEILASFGNKIKCLKEEKKGVSAARNKGLRAAQGEFITFLDDDDFYLPGKLSLSAKKLLEDHSVSLVYSDFLLVDSESFRTKTIKINHPPPEEFIWAFLKGSVNILVTTLIRKKCLEKSGYFDETLECIEDSDLWFRMLKAGYRFGHIPEPLTAYRRHPGNKSRNKEPMRFYADKIRSSAIEDFTVQELFGDIMKKNGWEKRVRREYNKLADTCCLAYLPLSTRAAAKKSLELGRLPFLLLFLTNAPQIFPILYRILENTVKIILASINPKLTRSSADKYRQKINAQFFRLRYRLSLLFRHNWITTTNPKRNT